MAESVGKPNSIQDFYAGKTIFITGPSGFMGKVLIEKLLYSCSEVKELIILMRPKKGKSVHERVESFSKLALFKRIMDEKPEIMKKIYPVSGEITAPNFGLSGEQLKRVVETTDIFFHLAASLKLEATLRPNIIINLLGTKYAIDIAKQMKNLIQMIHLSTAFCNVEPETVEEKVYDIPHDPLDLIRCAEFLSDEAMEALQKEILGAHRNTYTYTKRLAEILVRNEYNKGALPVCIVRPSIVTPSIKDPVPGWVDSLNGPIGIMYAGGKGVLRSMLADANARFDNIAVDHAINALILIAKFISTGSLRPKEIPAIHVTVSEKSAFTYGEVLEMSRKIGQNYPYMWALWYPNGEIEKNVWIHKIKVFFFQWIPAYILDFLLLLMRKKRFFVHVQNRIAVGTEVIGFFSMRNWHFNADFFHGLVNRVTPEELDMFPIDTTNHDEPAYIRDCLLGARQYCVNDPLSTLPAARVQYKIQYIIHNICKYLFWYIVIKAILKALGLYEPMTDFIAHTFRF